MITVDAIKKSSETDRIPLQWVGMEAVTLPVIVMLDGVKNRVPCDFDIFVNLINPSKGIHMSRLYEILSLYTQNGELSLKGVRDLLDPCVLSQNGLSSNAKIVITLSMPLTMTTLESKRSYIKSVPLKCIFTKSKNAVTTEIQFHLDYSSTCPQSAALANQLTISEMEKQNLQSGPEIIDWIQRRGFVATPHAQRSQASVSIYLDKDFDFSDFPNLFLQMGTCLGTPTQGLVKRVDEQEFARLNADNLMFCEDAARKLTVFLTAYSHALSGSGKVSHLESLHSHNAVSYFEF